MDTVVLVIRVVSVLPVVRMIISGTEEKACLYVTSQKPVNSTGGGSIPSCNAVVMRGNNTLASFFLVCFWFWYGLRAYYCWSGMACNLRLTNAVFRARRRNSSRTKKLIINHWKGKSFSRSLFQSTSTSPCCPQKKKKKTTTTVAMRHPPNSATTPPLVQVSDWVSIPFPYISLVAV